MMFVFIAIGIVLGIICGTYYMGKPDPSDEDVETFFRRQRRSSGMSVENLDVDAAVDRLQELVKEMEEKKAKPTVETKEEVKKTAKKKTRKLTIDKEDE